MTLETFLEILPEFTAAAQSAVGVAMINAALTQAAPEVGELFEECGMADRALALRAAHYVAIGPYGQAAKLVSQDGKTTWGELFQQLLAACTAGLRGI